MSEVTCSTLEGITVYQLKEFPLWHGFFGRNGGFGEAPYASLNTAYKTEDSASPQNREKLFRVTGLLENPIRILNPCHGEKVAFVEDAEWASEREGVLIQTDAAITRTANTYFLLSTADCLPVIFTDHKRSLAGIMHLGWRNIVAGFPAIVMAAVEARYGIKADEMIFGIGPSIYPCCYEFKDPIQKNDPFWTPFLTDRGDGVFAIDLVSATFSQLQAAGAASGAIIDTRLCTGCMNDQFFSCFKDGYISGRFPTLLGLSERRLM